MFRGLVRKKIKVNIGCVFGILFLQLLIVSHQVHRLHKQQQQQQQQHGGRHHNHGLSSLHSNHTNGKGRQRRRSRASRKAWRDAHWDPGRELNHTEPIPIKVGLPVFVTSLPKSGTTSIWQYFNCGGYRSSHQWVKLNETYTEQAGSCIKRNVEQDRPPFENCGEYDVYTDTGYAVFPKNVLVLPDSGGADCYYPSIEALDAIYNHYPNATIIMVLRDTDSWYNSMKSWGEGSLLLRWTNCRKSPQKKQADNDIPFPPKRDTPEDLKAFYDWHTNHVRSFAASHPSLKYVEIALDDKEAGAVLRREIGIPARCWGKCTPYSKFCKKVH